MAPLVERMHLLEINDQPWFPPFLRARVQAALTVLWTIHIPYVQPSSAAAVVANILSYNLKDTIRDYVFIDFCAGAGGPTPSIERHLNRSIRSSSSPPTNGNAAGGASYAEVTATGTDALVNHNDFRSEPARFVLTDLHPHVDDWKKAAAASPNLSYIADSVDATRAPAELIAKYKAQGKNVFRMFNLAFHHFDDPLARAILKNTIETGDGFGIFELQSRSIVGLLDVCLFGLGIVAFGLYYALVWLSPATLVFTYLIPILPLVLVFDGWVSVLRTRTPDEVEALLRTCGADGGDEELARWEVRSGKERFLGKNGYVHWIVCVKREEMDEL